MSSPPRFTALPHSATLLGPLCLLMLGCDGTRPPSQTAARSTSGPPAPPAHSSAASASPRPSLSSPGAAPSSPGSSGPSQQPASTSRPAAEPCGALQCRAFDTAADAFAAVLAEQPRVLAVGEAHAPSAAPSVPSATRRFAEQLLPAVRERTDHLVIELLLGADECDETERDVTERQKPVTRPQAESNQNEFVALGHVAKRLGIQPHALRPTCQDYRTIVEAGPADISRMLTLIAELTERQIKQLLKQTPPPPAGPAIPVIAYGGSLHNDLHPKQGRRAWSFGPQLAAHTDGRYLELDLIVREFIQDTEAWKALPWYEHFDRSARPDQALLMQPHPDSYVLFFPATRRADSGERPGARDTGGETPTPE